MFVSGCDVSPLHPSSAGAQWWEPGAGGECLVQHLPQHSAPASPHGLVSSLLSLAPAHLCSTHCSSLTCPRHSCIFSTLILQLWKFLIFFFHSKFYSFEFIILILCSSIRKFWIKVEQIFIFYENIQPWTQVRARCRSILEDPRLSQSQISSSRVHWCGEPGTLLPGCWECCQVSSRAFF